MAEDERPPWEDDEEAEDVEASEVVESYSPEQHQQAIATARAEAAAEERAKAQAEFDQRRSELSKRTNSVLEDARSKGFDVTADGKFVAADPRKAFATLFGTPASDAAPADTEIPDFDIFNKDERAQAIERIAERRAQAIVDERVKALEERFTQQFGSLAAAQEHVTRPTSERVVSSFFDKQGLSGMESNPDFKEKFDAIYANLDASSRIDPQQLRAAAGYAMGFVPEETMDKIRQEAVVKAAAAEKQAERDRMRNARGQYAPANDTRSITERYSQEQASSMMGNAASMVADALRGHQGWDEDLHKAVIAPDGEDGRSKVDLLTEKRAKAALKR